MDDIELRLRLFILYIVSDQARQQPSLNKTPGLQFPEVRQEMVHSWVWTQAGLDWA